MRNAHASALQADISVTPLVDVCLVLLIIFMVVTPIIVTGVAVKLPASRTADALGEASRQLPIAVKDDGMLFVDAAVIRREQLGDELRSRHDAHPDRPVVVRADGQVKYGEVVSVLDACRSAGFRDVGLATDAHRDATH
jgi:biopolymer transport protein ExbD